MIPHPDSLTGVDGVVIAITIGFAAIMESNILFMQIPNLNSGDSIVPMNIASKLSITAGIIPFSTGGKNVTLLIPFCSA